MSTLKASLEEEKRSKRNAVTKVKGWSPTPTPNREDYETDEKWYEACDKVKKTNEERARAYEERKAIVSEPFDERISELEGKITDLTADPKQYETIIANLKEERTKVDNHYNEIISQKDSDFLSQIGLKTKLEALHDIAMREYKPYNGGEKNTFLDVITLHPAWYYLLFSPIGLIMLLFILIDISPVLYKMMLADGKYDNYMHQDNLLAQDKIRLSLAKMLRNLNDSELKRVAPFVMGDIYEKMAGDSYIYKTEEEYKAEFEAQKEIHPIWRLWPLSMFRWLFWKEQSKPSAPVVVMEDKRVSKNETLLNDVNDKVFEEVLDMKRRLIVASYRRWYKTQHYKVDPNSEDNLVPPSDIPGDGSPDTPEA